jgi:hypothetical protein
MSSETQIAQPPTPVLNARVTAPIASNAPNPAAPRTNAASAPPVGGQEKPAAQPNPAPALGFQLQIDPETQRIILEAREPITGFIVFQSPPKTAFGSVVSSNSSTQRGKSVDRDI